MTGRFGLPLCAVGSWILLSAAVAGPLTPAATAPRTDVFTKSRRENDTKPPSQSQMPVFRLKINSQSILRFPRGAHCKDTGTAADANCVGRRVYPGGSVIDRTISSVQQAQRAVVHKIEYVIKRHAGLQRDTLPNLEWPSQHHIDVLVITVPGIVGWRRLNGWNNGSQSNKL